MLYRLFYAGGPKPWLRGHCGTGSTGNAHAPLTRPSPWHRSRSHTCVSHTRLRVRFVRWLVPVLLPGPRAPVPCGRSRLRCAVGVPTQGSPFQRAHPCPCHPTSSSHRSLSSSPGGTPPALRRLPASVAESFGAGAAVSSVSLSCVSVSLLCSAALRWRGAHAQAKPS